MQTEPDQNAPITRNGWQDFLRKSTLSLGFLLLASALICWIAANWAHATAFQKLFGVQAALSALVLAAWRLTVVAGADQGRQFSVVANVISLAAVATGALLALIGQIYQTGADPWGLFLLWAVLLIPWLIALHTIVLALLCATLLNTTAALYFDVSGGWLDVLSGWAEAGLLLALLNLMLWILWERGTAWLNDRWRIGPRVLGAAALVWLVTANIAASESSLWAFIIPSMLAMALMAWVYIRQRPDLAMVCLAALGAFSLIAILLLSWLETEGLLWTIILLTGLAGWGLRQLSALIRFKQPARLLEPWFLSLLRLAVTTITAGLTVLFIFITLDMRTGSFWAVGLVIGAIGLWVSRTRRSGMGHELGAASMVAGLLLISIDMVGMDSLDANIRAAIMLSAGALFYAFAHNTAVRFLCVVLVLGIVLVLTWPMQDHYGLLDALDGDTLWMSLPLTLRLWWLAVAAVLALTLGARSRDAAFWMPLAWGLIGLTQLLAWMTPAPTLFWLSDSWHPVLTVLWLACAVLPVLLLTVFLWRQQAMSNALRFGAPMVLAVASLGWIGAPGIAMALAWIILGYGLAQRSLLGFGVLALLAYLARFYYLLDSSLLQKSWILGLTGAWLLLAWWGLRWMIRRPTPLPQATPKVQAQRRLWHEAGLVTGLLLILLVANTGIYQREQTLATGQQVILALAPVDPRSLMQGDYMALNFSISAQVSSALRRAPADLAEHIEEQRGGYLVLRPDEQGIHQLVAIKADIGDSHANTSSNDVMLAFRLRNRRVRIVTDAWFFPEGQAEHYERARYGEFRVDHTGQGLLTHMLDEERQVLP